MDMGKMLLATVTVLAVVVAGALVLLAGRSGGGASTTSSSSIVASTTPSGGLTQTASRGAAPPWRPDGVVSPGEYARHESFGGGVFEVYWRVENGTLYMALVGRTTGWVAVGFEPSRAMADADIVLGYVADNGSVIVRDEYSLGETGPHKPDTILGGQYNILASGGAERDGVTIIEFSRPLRTGDSYDKDLTSKTTVTIIWAIGSSDDPRSIHTERGYGTLTLRP